MYSGNPQKKRFKGTQVFGNTQSLYVLQWEKDWFRVVVLGKRLISGGRTFSSDNFFLFPHHFQVSICAVFFGVAISLQLWPFMRYDWLLPWDLTFHKCGDLVLVTSKWPEHLNCIIDFQGTQSSNSVWGHLLGRKPNFGSSTCDGGGDTGFRSDVL